MTTPARNDGSQAVQTITKDIAFSDVDTTVTVGVLPAGAVVLRAGAIVSTAFNSGSTDILDIGTSADSDGFATDISLATIGVIAADEMATTNDAGPYASDTTIVCVPAQTGTAASAGAARVYVEFIADN